LAGIEFYGRPLYAPKSGLYVVPLFLLSLSMVSRNYKDVRFPGPADKIFRVSEAVQQSRPDGGDMPPPGSDLVRPIFVTTGEPRLTPEERAKRSEDPNANPLDEQLNIEIAYFVRYRPHEAHGGIFRITRNIGHSGNLDEEIKNLITEQSERDMKAILTQLTTATIVANWDLVNEVFALKLQASILRLGIQVDPRGGGLDDVNPSRETNTKQADVARARFDRQTTIAKADAEEQKRIREGRGTATARQLALEAEAAGLKKLKEEAGVDGVTATAAEVAKAAFANADSVMAGASSGLTDILGAVRTGTEMLNRGRPATPPNAPTNPTGEPG
jgi:regulator of protease activity HflC (stomatin/prohibitin superfamily)